MTTIAVNREEMAADSQESQESGLIISYGATKVRRLNGDLVACQGRDDEITLFEQWYEAGCPDDEKPEISDEDNFAALVLTSEGRILRCYSPLVFVEHLGEFAALGMGDEIAIGAMAAGASPREAVEIACRLNVWTGPPVVVERI